MEANLSRFRVSLGHLRVVVEAADTRDAIARARERFCREMPRLWDVITRLDASRFEVDAPGPPRRE